MENQWKGILDGQWGYTLCSLGLIPGLGFRGLRKLIRITS